MSNLMKELKSEIVRQARKEIKREMVPAKRVTAAHRALIADLRRLVDALKRDVAALKKSVPAKALATAQAPAGRFWITGKGVKALRKRLGLTQAQFGKLVGVSVVTVVKWEAHKGKTPIRLKAAIARLQAIRKMGKKQAVEMLGPGKKDVAGKKGIGKAKPKAKHKAKTA